MMQNLSTADNVSFTVQKKKRRVFLFLDRLFPLPHLFFYFFMIWGNKISVALGKTILL